MGGSVILVLDSSKSDLAHLARRSIQRAGHGQPGGSAQKHGKNGEDLVVLLPEHTAISDLTGHHITEITKKNPRYVLLAGGKGGFGNIHFKSSRNQAPYRAQQGEPEESISILARMTRFADVMIAGNTINAVAQAFASITEDSYTGDLVYGKPSFAVASGNWNQIKMLLLPISAGSNTQHTHLLEYVTASPIVVFTYEIGRKEDVTEWRLLLEGLGSVLGERHCFVQLVVNGDPDDLLQNSTEKIDSVEVVHSEQQLAGLHDQHDQQGAVNQNGAVAQGDQHEDARQKKGKTATEDGSKQSEPNMKHDLAQYRAVVVAHLSIPDEHISIFCKDMTDVGENVFWRCLNQCIQLHCDQTHANW